MKDKERIKALEAVIRDLIGEDDICVIEENLDEGDFCFFCNRRADVYFRINHAVDCPVVKARELLGDEK